MNPKEKAKELIEKYCQVLFGDEQFVNLTKPIKCALIAVDEIWECMKADDEKHDCCHWCNSPEMKFWDDVKEEISKLR